jgi:hypothetical protein
MVQKHYTKKLKIKQQKPNQKMLFALLLTLASCFIHIQIRFLHFHHEPQAFVFVNFSVPYNVVFVPMQGLDFKRPLSKYFLIFFDLRWELFVRFLDRCGIEVRLY